MKNYVPELTKVKNPKGPILCYTADSGVVILEFDGLFFKDHTKDGILHPFEDWRLSPEARAHDLAMRLSAEQLAGLMLHTSHQFVPGIDSPYFGNTLYDGKSRQESGAPIYALTDKQINKISSDFVRHMLVASVRTPADAALWNNNLQALAEKQPFSIPVSLSSDPRHGTIVSFEFDVGASGTTSKWPEPLGLAATFDPDLVRKFGEIASREYRALGITTALSPQIDLATDPRWCRFIGTFGESSVLSADLARAYCDGFQTSVGSREINDGWGYDSVIAMVKHWPGGGAIEGGRDAHFACGKYSVYPGYNFSEHLLPFVEGAFRLKGKTDSAAAVMPYYTIVYDQDKADGENVGASYDKYLITDLLRNQSGYDELVCNDWGILRDPAPSVDSLFGGKCWGVEELTMTERCYKALLAGVDQFGGLDDQSIIWAAYQMGVREFGEVAMRSRLEQSAVRILKNIFRVGLFENPYLDATHSSQTVGHPDFVAAGYAAQIKSVIMLKNKNNCLPITQKSKLFLPQWHIPAYTDWMGVKSEERWEYPMDPDLVRQYFELTDDPTQADAALCVIRMPDGAASGMLAGYSVEDRQNGGNGYVPISLQYRSYTAEFARSPSIAGGDPNEDFTDRSYLGKTVSVDNEDDLDMVLKTRKAMANKPVIVCVKMKGPLVMREFEPSVDAILGSFGEQPKAVSGDHLWPARTLRVVTNADSSRYDNRGRAI
jgi:beta-glucosidase